MKTNPTLFALSLATALSPSAFAADLTWDPDGDQTSNGGAGAWSTTVANWDDNGSAPNVNWNNADNAFFGSGTYQVGLDSTGVTVGNLTYAGGGILTLIGSTASGSPADTITVNSGGATWNTGGGEIEFSNDGNDNNTRLSMTSGDTLTVAGGGTFDTGQNPQNNANGTWSVSGATLDVTGATNVLGHAGSIGLFETVKLGAGSTYIHERNSNQTYANDWVLGGGTITFSNRHTGNGNITVNGEISGNADEFVIDMGNTGRIVNLTQAAAFTAGTVRVAEGQLNLSADNAVSESVIILGGIDGKTSRMIMFDTDQAIKGLKSEIGTGTTQDIRNNTAASTSILTIDVDTGESYNYGSTILGTGNIDIVKTGDGTQIFSYSGGYGTALGNLTANGGTLNWQNDTAADIGGAITVGASGIFLVGDGATNGTIGDKNVANEGTLTFSRNDAVTYGGVISGGGKLVLDSGVALSLTNDANTFSGGIEINDGSALLATTAARLGDAANDITLSNGGILNLNGVDLGSTREITLNGTGGSIVNSNNVNTFAGKITGSGELQIGDAAYNTFSNRLVLTGNTSDYTGGTRIHNGSIELGSNNALPTTTVLTLGSGTSASRLFMEGFDAEIGGLALAGFNTREIVNNGASVSTLTINVASGSHDYSANFNGSTAINIVKTGDGTQIFSRTGAGYSTALNDITVTGGELVWNNDTGATQTGTFSVSTGGTLSGSGVIGGAATVAGNLNPGNSPGTLTFLESLTLESTATTTLQIEQFAVGMFDVLANDGGDIFTAAGTLALDTTGYTAMSGDTFLVLENWAGFAGSFSSITGTDLGGGLSFDTSTLLTNGTLTVIPEPHTGLLSLVAGLLVFVRRRRN